MQTAAANGACAVDLAASAVGDFAAHVRAVNPHCRVAAVIGHSLGGKIALRHLARLGDANALPPHPTQWWSLDSVPSAVAHPDDDPHGVQRVIDAVRNHLPRTFAAREELGDGAVRDAGRRYVSAAISSTGSGPTWHPSIRPLVRRRR